MISDKNDWLKFFKQNKEILKNIVNLYAKNKLDLFVEISNNPEENHLEINKILNNAWFNAPDDPLIHLIPGWGSLCDLCSEYHVFQE